MKEFGQFYGPEMMAPDGAKNGHLPQVEKPLVEGYFDAPVTSINVPCLGIKKELAHAKRIHSTLLPQEKATLALIGTGRQFQLIAHDYEAMGEGHQQTGWITSSDTAIRSLRDKYYILFPFSKDRYDSAGNKLNLMRIHHELAKPEPHEVFKDYFEQESLTYEEYKTEVVSQLYGFSNVDVEIISYVSCGFSINQIGRTLGIDPSEIETHMHDIYQSLTGLVDNNRYALSLLWWYFQDDVLAEQESMDRLRVSDELESARLTREETDVYKLLVMNGYSNEEMAQLKGISEKTVRTHMLKVFSKTNTHSREKLIQAYWGKRLKDIKLMNETGSILLPEEDLQGIVRTFTKEDLSPTEFLIINHLLKGLTNEEIAQLQKVDIKTIKGQMASISEKARLDSRAKIMVAYYRAISMYTDEDVRFVRPLSNPETDPTRLTEKEQQVLDTLVQNGYTNSELAEQMGVTEATIRTHINNIFAKKEVNSRAKLITTYWTELIPQQDHEESAISTLVNEDNYFTAKEREIVRAVVSGISNDDIARSFNISVKTVKTHLGSILLKTSCYSREKVMVAYYKALRDASST